MKKDITAVIQGGQTPKGTVKVSGAKNSATRLLAASLISDEKITLENFPTELVDANYKFDFIEKSGGQVIVDREKEVVQIESNNLNDKILDTYNYPIRTTYLLVAGLIKANGVARIPYPGGCKIGNRGYDLHIMTWEDVQAFFKGLSSVAMPKAYLCVYGPFKYNEQFTSDSNYEFDQSLRSRVVGSAIRDFEAVNECAMKSGFNFIVDNKMPANNQLIIWQNGEK